MAKPGVWLDDFESAGLLVRDRAMSLLSTEPREKNCLTCQLSASQIIPPPLTGKTKRMTVGRAVASSPLGVAADLLFPPCSTIYGAAHTRGKS